MLPTPPRKADMRVLPNRRVRRRHRETAFSRHLAGKSCLNVAAMHVYASMPHTGQRSAERRRSLRQLPISRALPTACAPLRSCGTVCALHMQHVGEGHVSAQSVSAYPTNAPVNEGAEKSYPRKLGACRGSRCPLNAASAIPKRPRTSQTGSWALESLHEPGCLQWWCRKDKDPLKRIRQCSRPSGASPTSRAAPNDA